MKSITERIAQAMCRESYGDCVCEQQGKGVRSTHCSDKLRLAAVALEVMYQEDTVKIDKLQAKEGDTLVLHFPPKMDAESLGRLNNYANEVLNDQGVAVLLMRQDVGMTVLQKDPVK